MATKTEDPLAIATSSAAVTDPAAGELFDKRKVKDDEQEEERESESRETKRRRTTRQLALEKLPPNSLASELSGRKNRPGLLGLSFSFDTRLSAPIETTPKFGSFNLTLDLAGLENSYGDDKLAKKAEEEEDRNETGEDAEGKIGI